MMNFLKSIFEKSYENLSGSEFKNKYKTTAGAVLIDVRTQGEFSGGSIRGARNINYMSPQFSKSIDSLDKNKTYFLFCRSGARSGSAAQKMGKLGFKVYNLNGGIGAWPD